MSPANCTLTHPETVSGDKNCKGNYVSLCQSSPVILQETRIYDLVVLKHGTWYDNRTE